MSGCGEDRCGLGQGCGVVPRDCEGEVPHVWFGTLFIDLLIILWAYYKSLLYIGTRCRDNAKQKKYGSLYSQSVGVV